MYKPLLKAVLCKAHHRPIENQVHLKLSTVVRTHSSETKVTDKAISDVNIRSKVEFCDRTENTEAEGSMFRQTLFWQMLFQRSYSEATLLTLNLLLTLSLSLSSVGIVSAYHCSQLRWGPNEKWGLKNCFLCLWYAVTNMSMSSVCFLSVQIIEGLRIPFLTLISDSKLGLFVSKDLCLCVHK